MRSDGRRWSSRFSAPMNPAEAEETAAVEDITAISRRLIAKNRTAYEELAK